MSNSSPDDSSSLYLSINSITSLTINSDDLFKNRNFPQQFLQSLHLALENKQLIDVELVTEDGKRIPAHKIVLSVCSPYFHCMFNSNLRESNEKEITINEIDGEILELLINYCYAGKISINEDNVERILSTACLFQISSVVAACSNFLGKQLHFSNGIGFLLFAEQQNCDDLYQLSLNFVESNFMEIYQRSEEYVQMDVEQITKLLKNENLNVNSEEDVFKALKRWISHVDERIEHLPTLLQLVKLPQLSSTFIADNVEELCSTIETQKMLIEAYKFQLIPERRNFSEFYGKPRKSTVGILLSIGGMDSQKGTVTIESFDLRDNKWSLLKNMPTRRLQFGCALYRDKLIIVGGRDGLKTLNTVDAIDLQTMSWTSLSSPMGTTRHGLGVALMKNALYAVGGHDGWSYLNSVERLDLTTKTWSYVAPMSTMRSTCAVIVLQEKLYVLGGRESSICHRSVECYDPLINRWTTKAPMNKRRGGAAAVSYKGSIFVFGGHDLPVSNPACQRTNSIEKYSPVTDSWILIANLDLARDSIGVGILGNFIIVIGGYDGNNYLDTVEQYDPETNELKPLKNLNYARAGSCIVTIDKNQLSGCSNESFFSLQQASHSTTV